MEENTDLPPPASASSTKLVVNLSVEEEKESLRKYIEPFPIFAFYLSVANFEFFSLLC